MTDKKTIIVGEIHTPWGERERVQRNGHDIFARVITPHHGGPNTYHLVLSFRNLTDLDEIDLKTVPIKINYPQLREMIRNMSDINAFESMIKRLVHPPASFCELWDLCSRHKDAETGVAEPASKAKIILDILKEQKKTDHFKANSADRIFQRSNYILNNFATTDPTRIKILREAFDVLKINLENQAPLQSRPWRREELTDEWNTWLDKRRTWDESRLNNQPHIGGMRGADDELTRMNEGRPRSVHKKASRPPRSASRSPPPPRRNGGESHGRSMKTEDVGRSMKTEDVGRSMKTINWADDEAEEKRSSNEKPMKIIKKPVEKKSDEEDDIKPIKIAPRKKTEQKI